MKLLRQAQKSLGAKSLTEGLRRSAKVILKIEEFQKDGRKVLLQDSNGTIHELVLV